MLFFTLQFVTPDSSGMPTGFNFTIGIISAVSISLTYLIIFRFNNCFFDILRFTKVASPNVCVELTSFLRQSYHRCTGHVCNLYFVTCNLIYMSLLTALYCNM